MKKYYLHNGTESSGPFDIEELKAKNITKASPVWFEGMLHWKTAGEIPELNQLFVVNPPVFPLFETRQPTPKVATKKEARKILGLSINVFFTVCAAVVFLIGIIVLNTIEENRSRELRIKNHKTEVENYQLELKQKELDEQKIQAVIQEKIDAERKARALTQNANNRLLEIEKLLASFQDNMVETEKKLEQASGFKLLRTGAEKKEQMDLLQKNIDSFRTAINELKKESDQLKLEMEKIPN
ncbi:GYF domain-containing protein [Flavobacterium sp.]|uniref:GYF domain-containing protein n=1 Tax=Flavobacterium sp. TaxID=239 RepID=UPI00286E1D0A|nr:GYF domain-containing protein [Flavobacterium sp.]